MAKVAEKPAAKKVLRTARREIQLPITKGPWPILCGRFPMTTQAWDQMIAMLEALKPGLVMEEERGTKGPERKGG